MGIPDRGALLQQGADWSPAFPYLLPLGGASAWVCLCSDLNTSLSKKNLVLADTQLLPVKDTKLLQWYILGLEV